MPPAAEYFVGTADGELAFHVAVAPLLKRKIDNDGLSKPGLGTLIFHPSLLPRHRGQDAIRWAYHLSEQYTGVTWFWADSGLDTGAVCEQEVVAITGKRARDFYEQDIIPACVRTLRYAILDLKKGIVRRRPQNEQAGTKGGKVTSNVTRKPF